MIRVEVEEYCHACLDFSPDVIKPQRVRCVDGDNAAQSDTVIKCEHRKRCANIRRYLEHQMKTCTGEA